MVKIATEVSNIIVKTERSKVAGRILSKEVEKLGTKFTSVGARGTSISAPELCNLQGEKNVQWRIHRVHAFF